MKKCQIWPNTTQLRTEALHQWKWQEISFKSINQINHKGARLSVLVKLMTKGVVKDNHGKNIKHWEIRMSDKSDIRIQDHRTGDRKTWAASKNRHKPVNVMCNDEWNIGLRRCPGKMTSLGRPTLRKKTHFLKLGFPGSCFRVIGTFLAIY